MPRIRPAISPAPKSRLEIPDVSAIAARARGRRQIGTPKDIAFRLPEHPPGVKPVTGSGIAMDEMPGQSEALAWAAGQAIASAFHEGIGFLGYTYLSELAQRPEYRVISETIAEEMTRKWIRLQAKSGDEDKGERIKELNESLDDLNVREAFRLSAINDGFFGRSHLYIDTGDTDDRDELQTSIGGGRDKMSKAKISPKKPVLAIRPIEALWCYPLNYNSSDPLRSDWYRPNIWSVNGKPIHRTRLLTIIGHPVPDLLKPAYSFGGLSRSQMVKPYVDNWLRTRQSVSDLIHSFTVFSLSTDMSQLLRRDGDQLFRRMELFTNLRDNSGLFLHDKNTEEIDNISAPLGTLDALQAQSQEQMASIARTPLVKLLGIQPLGLNASSEGEIRVFYDTIHALQDIIFRPDLRIIIDFLMLSLWGEVDEEITFDFEPLWSLDEKGEAEVRKTNAETAQIHIETGIISPEEERMRVARDPATPYEGLDPTELPDLKEEEEEGLGVPGRGAGEPGGSAEGEPDKHNGEPDKEGAEDRILPFDEAPEPAQDEWNESDHPRGQPGNAGQFGSGSGGSSSQASAATEPTAGAGVAKKKKPPEGFKSHRAHVGHLLKNGVTTKQVLEATGWPSVSMPQIAKSLGVELVKKQENGKTVYYSIEKSSPSTGIVSFGERFPPDADIQKDQEAEVGNHLVSYDVAYTKDGRVLVGKVRVWMEPEYKTDSDGEIERDHEGEVILAPDSPVKEEGYYSAKDHLDADELSAVQAEIDRVEQGEITDRAELAAEADRWDALTPEQQQGEINAQAEAEKIADQQRTARVNDIVDAAIASGWHPKVNEYGGWERPASFKEFASPKSGEAIYNRLEQHGIPIRKEIEEAISKRKAAK